VEPPGALAEDQTLTFCSLPMRLLRTKFRGQAKVVSGTLLGAEWKMRLFF